MKRNLLKTKSLTLAVAAFVTAAIAVSACRKDRTDQQTEVPTAIDLKDYSVNPSLVKTMPGFEALKISTLISSDDVLPESPNFIFGAQPDGAGTGAGIRLSAIETGQQFCAAGDHAGRTGRRVEGQQGAVAAALDMEWQTGWASARRRRYGI